MRFYTLSSKYVEYLQRFDSRVPNHSGTGYVQKKPYIGVVLNIDGNDFLAPMTSPKSWHAKIKPSDHKYFKIYHIGNANQELGLISIRYMLPVLTGAYQEIDFNTCDTKYVTLLQAQFDFIKPRREIIKLKSEKIYDLVVNKKQKYFVESCCNFSILLNNYRGYEVK